MARSILITGCSSGIGENAARTLHARAGWRVFATCRKPEDAARLSAEGLESFVLDYADEASIAAAVDEALARTGGTLDAVFNNGAFGLPGAVEDLPRGALREIFETNVFGVHDLTRRVIPAMRAQGHGRIVQHSSVLGFVHFRWRGAYSASKYALEALTDTLRLEMRDTEIHVSTLNTGPVPTRLRENSIPHFERWIDWEGSARAQQYRDTLLKRLYDRSGKPDPFQRPPDAVTAKLIHAIESPRPRARYHITTLSYLMDAMHRLLPPRGLDWLIDRV